MNVQTTAPTLETRLIGTPDAHLPTLVLLHEGLGSVSAWRDFPDRLAQACGLAALVYSRRGYGASPAFEGALGPDFMHRAACEELPALLREHGVRRPILVGHSDGASIALIAAGDGAVAPLGVACIAPHLFVEPVCIESISHLATDADRRARVERSLARHHQDPVATLRHWTDAWLNPAFRSWNIEESVERLQCPVLAIQGEADEYGSLEQIRRIASLHPDTRLIALAGCGHHPHIERPEVVIDAITDFVRARCLTAATAGARVDR